MTEEQKRATTMEGDADKFPFEVEGHRHELLAYAKRKLRNGPDAEELVQETIYRALTRREQYKPSKGEIAEWQQGIAAHLISDYRRKRKRRAQDVELDALPEPPPIPGGEDPAVEYGEQWQRDKLYRRIARLPLVQQLVLVLTFFYKMPRCEIAQYLGLSKRRVSYERSEGLKAMRRMYHLRKVGKKYQEARFPTTLAGARTDEAALQAKRGG